jgi:hypothetical protein
MTFIRTKKIKGQIYYYRVENYAQNGKVKQRVLEYSRKMTIKRPDKDDSRKG